MRIIGAILVSLLVAPAIYVGAYYVMVDPIEFPASTAGTIHFGRFVLCQYRFCNEWSQTVFYPVHFLDRRLRSDYWGDR